MDNPMRSLAAGPRQGWPATVRAILCGVAALIGFTGVAPEGLAQPHCRPYWTAAYKCTQGCGPCPGNANSPRPPSSFPADITARLANDLENQGIEAFNSGDYTKAAELFGEALDKTPDNPVYQKNLQDAKDWIAVKNHERKDLVDAQRDALALWKLKILMENLEGGVSSQRLLYPALLRPAPADSLPAVILAQSQPTIKDLDERIHHTQELLRRLIAANTQDEAARLEWTRESERFIVDAEHLGLSLVSDLIGAHVDQQIAIADKERAEVLTRLVNRTDDHGQSIHSAYGMLVNRKTELETVKSLLGAANRLSAIEDLMNTSYTVEKFWDLISMLKQVEQYGPWKDLGDAGYQIYRQAVIMDQLAAVQTNQEQTLKAATLLRRYIQRLEAQEQVAKAPASARMP